MKINITLDIAPAEILELAKNWDSEPSGGHRAPPPSLSWAGKKVKMSPSSEINVAPEDEGKTYVVNEDFGERISLKEGSQIYRKSNFYLVNENQ